MQCIVSMIMRFVNIVMIRTDQLKIGLLVEWKMLVEQSVEICSQIGGILMNGNFYSYPL